MKRVFSEEWARPKEYLLLKNIGVMSFSILGGTIIDRCISQGKVDIDDMEAYLTQTRARINWSTGGDVAGKSGNRAALIIAGEMAQELSDETGISAKTLEEKLLGVAPA